MRERGKKYIWYIFLELFSGSGVRIRRSIDFLSNSKVSNNMQPYYLESNYLSIYLAVYIYPSTNLFIYLSTFYLRCSCLSSFSFSLSRNKTKMKSLVPKSEIIKYQQTCTA